MISDFCPPTLPSPKWPFYAAFLASIRLVFFVSDAYKITHLRPLEFLLKIARSSGPLNRYFTAHGISCSNVKRGPGKVP